MDDRRGYKLFDNCPNRSVSVDDGWCVVNCPKYPKGIDFVQIQTFENASNRDLAALRIGCLGCRYSTVEYEPLKKDEQISALHPAIYEAARVLYVNEHYQEAAKQGYLVVRDKLRELTGFENATGAFSGGNLYINGSMAEHIADVDADYQKAAKYLMMAIDALRNEVSHTACRSTTGSEDGLERLSLSSLAMHMLDNAVVDEEKNKATFAKKNNGKQE